MIGPLCNALYFYDKAMRKQAELALIELLPTLQATDNILINSAQRSNLHLALTRKKPEFTLTALKALEQIGNKASVPAVKRLIKRCGDDTKYCVVREAAEESLLFLQAQDARGGDTLLRPSEIATPPDVLLRPAQKQTPVPAEQLLRIPDNNSPDK